MHFQLYGRLVTHLFENNFSQALNLYIRGQINHIDGQIFK
jgi:hypothetical protein